MSQRDQVVDHRYYADAIAFDPLDLSEEVRVPGRVQQQQLIPRLVLQRGATFKQLRAIDPPNQAQLQAERAEAGQPVADVQNPSRQFRGALCIASLMPLAEAMSQALQAFTEVFKFIEEWRIERCELQDAIELAI